MSLRNESGQIVIDELAAAADMTNLKNACQALENFKDTLIKEHRKADSVWDGLANNKFSEKTSSLVRDIDTALTHITASYGFIDSTVKHYQEIDKKLRNTFLGGNK